LIWYAAISIALIMSAIGRGNPARLVAYLGEYEPYYVYGAVLALKNATLTDLSSLAPLGSFAILYLVIPALIVGPPTFLMGVSFPFLQRACQSDLQVLGRRVGALLSANISGKRGGDDDHGLVAAAGVRHRGHATDPRRSRRLAGRSVMASIERSLTPGDDGRRARDHLCGPDGATGRPHALGAVTWLRTVRGDRREDGSGVSVLKPSQSSRNTAVFVNGIGQSWIPYGGIHTVLGALPALLHPDPQNIVIIGLGSGDTAFAAAGRNETTRLTCVEIIGAQLTTLRRHSAIQPYPGLTRVLTDPRIDHVIGDGRAFVLRSGPVFDIIEMDALRPTSAYAGNLYSREYFDLLRRRLKPGGFAVTWAPTARTRDTFASVFPHALVFGDIMIGSNDPIAFDPAVIKVRLAPSATIIRKPVSTSWACSARTWPRSRTGLGRAMRERPPI
jgi:hypothetical protein